jgi:hypothetical protein
MGVLLELDVLGLVVYAGTAGDEIPETRKEMRTVGRCCVFVPGLGSGVGVVAVGVVVVPGPGKRIPSSVAVVGAAELGGGF